MAKPRPRHTEDHTFAPIADAPPPNEYLTMAQLHGVRLYLTANLGTCTMQVRDVLELRRGSVVQLNKQAGEMMDIFLNDIPLAKGEVVVIGDSLHVRIGEIIGTSDPVSNEEE